MKSRTKIKQRVRNKTNPYLVETLKASMKNENWNVVTNILSGPTRKYPSINPHLTIGQLTKFQDTDRIKKEISTTIQSRLPIKTFAEEVWLMEENKGEWSLRVKFSFID
jgi:hypothetical protein